MSLYLHQPFKGLYTLASVLVILFIRVPCWTAIAAIPALRPRKTWSLKRTLIVWGLDTVVGIMNRVSPSDTFYPAKDALKADELGFVWVEPIPQEMVRGEIADMAAINQTAPIKVWGYWHGKRGVDGKSGQRPKEGEKVLYSLHGGGYTRGTGSPKSPSTGIIRGTLDTCAGTTDRLFSIDYRLASSAPLPPKNAYPAALIDALAGYNYLINVVGFKAEDVIIIGDSAGGHLAFNLVRYLITHNVPALPVPKGVILLSPTMDWGQTHDGSPQSSMNRNKYSDFVAKIMKSGYSARSLLGSLPSEDIKTNTWLSPASLAIQKTEGLFVGFPQTLILAGGAEQTLDGMRTIRDRIDHDNPENKCTYLEYEDAPHDWVGFSFIEPERTQALNVIKDWLRKL